MFKLKKFVSDSWSDFGSFKVYDHDIAEVLRKHLRFRDRFNFDKVVEAAAWAHTLMAENEGKDPFDKSYRFEFSGKEY